MATKSPSELNSRTIRVGLAEYQVLNKESQRYGLTIAETVRQWLDACHSASLVSASHLCSPGCTLKQAVTSAPTPVKQPVIGACSLKQPVTTTPVKWSASCSLKQAVTSAPTPVKQLSCRHSKPS
jgi:hypothetical protein